MKKKIALVMLACLCGAVANAAEPFDSLHYRVELQTTLSGGDHTPLWLNANKYGLSSLEKTNGYVRAAVDRPLSVDDGNKWGLGYGLDVALAHHFTSTLVVQQAYLEGRWLKGTLTVGSKEYPMELKNNALSSGSQALGINARPIPQVRLALPDYWTIPYTKDWLAIKGHIAYGKPTDDNWQKDFTHQQSKYTQDTWHHSKAGYLRIGKEDKPFSAELGLEMAAQFGGTTYEMDPSARVVNNTTNLKAFFHALIPGGGDAVETTYQNEEGNQIGSWMMRLNYQTDNWKVSVYGEKFFEDQSAMFMLDYDGYGTGEEWNVKKESHYFLYDLKDMMLGAEFNLLHGTWLRDVVFEYLHTKYQSGPVYHDRTISFPDHIGGIDDYCNHYIFTGWQHWGQVMGNPLYLSPLYNNNGEIKIQNNRFMAFHLGLSGRPMPGLSYRVLATWQDGLGIYKYPYPKKKESTNILVEATYAFPEGKLAGWTVTGAYGADFGDLRGDNQGFQLTLTKKGLFGK